MSFFDSYDNIKHNYNIQIKIKEKIREKKELPSRDTAVKPGADGKKTTAGPQNYRPETSYGAHKHIKPQQKSPIAIIQPVEQRTHQPGKTPAGGRAGVIDGKFRGGNNFVKCRFSEIIYGLQG